MMYVAVPLAAMTDRIVGALRTSASPSTSIDDTLAAIQIRISPSAGFLAAMGAAAISLLVTRRLSRPIEDDDRSVRGALPTAT
jgi:hypothetical protein